MMADNDKEAMIKKLLDEEMSLMSQSETESVHGSSSLYSDQQDQDQNEPGLNLSKSLTGTDLRKSQPWVDIPLVYEVRIFIPKNF